MKLKRLYWLSFALLSIAAPSFATPSHGIAPFGNLKYPADFEHFDYVNPDAPKGGRIKFAHTSTFDSLNPFILKGVPAPGVNAIFESLMTASLDEPQAYYGLIAESIEIADDHSYADFVLRKQARWHDGKPITADDVVFSFYTLKEKGHPSFRIIYKPIDKVEKLDEYRVRFHFSEPQNRELPLLAASMNIIPKHYYETHEFDKTTLEPPLGSGPYRIKNVDAARSISFERVKDYWGTDLPVNVGLNNFDEMIYDIYRDETVAVEAIKSQQYDVREEYIARNWATAYKLPAIDRGEMIKINIPNKIPRGMQAFLFNERQAKFADPKVREAISLTMDFEWMNETLFYGAYTRTESFFQNTDFMAKDLPSKDELTLLEPFKKDLPEALFTQAPTLPHSDGSGYDRANMLKAQDLLNEAGWVMRDGVRVNKDSSEPLTVEFLMRQRTFEKVVSGMMRNLKKLGIKSTFRYVDDSQYQKRIDDRDFDIISVWWNLGLFFPGNEQVSYWHSSQADVIGGNNLSGMKKPVIDALLDKIVNAKTLEQLTPAARALDRVLLWDHVAIPHWYLSSWRMLYWNKFDRPETAPLYGLGIESWWSKEAKP